MYNTFRSSSKYRNVWWDGKPPGLTCYDAMDYPRAKVFGQVFGQASEYISNQYIGTGGSYWEIGAPLFEENTRKATLINQAFERQMHHMEQFRRGEERMQVPSNAIVPHGVVFRVEGRCGDEFGAAGALIGHTVVITTKLRECLVQTTY
ncbi:hypothetical protein C8R43DRAFT_949170 [Mycena crocata]|nr:hypothetical protein C8R43DRAFT_949170 [Mycena crocata]